MQRRAAPFFCKDGKIFIDISGWSCSEHVGFGPGRPPMNMSNQNWACPKGITRIAYQLKTFLSPCLGSRANITTMPATLLRDISDNFVKTKTAPRARQLLADYLFSRRSLPHRPEADQEVDAWWRRDHRLMGRGELIQTQPKYINYEQPHPPYENREGCSGTWHYTSNVPALHCHQRRRIAQATLLSLRQFFNRRISVSVHWPASANFLRSDGVIKSVYAELYAPYAPINMHSRDVRKEMRYTRCKRIRCGTLILSENLQYDDPVYPPPRSHFADSAIGQHQCYCRPNIRSIKDRQSSESR